MLGLYLLAEETRLELGQEGYYSFYARAAHWDGVLRH